MAPFRTLSPWMPHFLRVGFGANPPPAGRRSSVVLAMNCRFPGPPLTPPRPRMLALSEEQRGNADIGGKAGGGKRDEGALWRRKPGRG